MYAWMFPGQGSQSVGMVKDILDASPAARRVFVRADAALGEPLSRLILEGPDETLTLTANAQPAIVTASYAVLEALRERVPGLRAPTFAAGHSLGEYSALVAAGSLSFEDALRLVRQRGLAMQDAVAPGVGAMAAVMTLETEKVVALCKEAAQGEICAPANFNAPGQIVIAGHAAAIARAVALADQAGGRAKPLNVSAPFHCALMAPAAEAVSASLAKVTILAPEFPIVANYDARPNSDPLRTRELLTRQVDGTVRWEESVRFLADSGVRLALEIGPGKVLQNLAKRIAKEMRVISVFDKTGLEEAAAAVRSLG